MAAKNTADQIKVDETKLEDLDEAITNLNSIFVDEGGLRDSAKSITGILDSGRWEGEAYERFRAAHDYLVQYEQQVGDAYEKLKDAIKGGEGLIAKTDSFESESQVVAIIK